MVTKSKSVNGVQLCESTKSHLHDFDACEYPASERQGMLFGIKYIRWLFDSGTAEEIGPDATALLCAVVSLEDELHYRRSPNFFNQQLMRRCGMLSEHALIRARRIAEQAGLLFYQPGAKTTTGAILGQGIRCGIRRQIKQIHCGKRSGSQGKAQGKQGSPYTNPYTYSCCSRKELFLW